jgi:ketosteroid isomerase-like protein
MVVSEGGTMERMALSPVEVHRRLIESYPEILAGRFNDALALIDPDVIDHRGGGQGDHYGIDAWRQKWERMGNSEFHNVSVTVEQNVTSGDTSVNRYTSRGTHTASGRSYEILSMDMIRVRDGKVIEHWALQDANARRQQLGLSDDA